MRTAAVVNLLRWYVLSCSDFFDPLCNLIFGIEIWGDPDVRWPCSSTGRVLTFRDCISACSTYARLGGPLSWNAVPGGVNPID